MAKTKNDLLAEVVTRYMFHANFTTDDPNALYIKQMMCNIELSEMWMLTQK